MPVWSELGLPQYAVAGGRVADVEEEGWMSVSGRQVALGVQATSSASAR
ncbi:hypothetical protein ACFXKC_08340 [Streptomyces sp. NPDC059340]